MSYAWQLVRIAGETAITRPDGAARIWGWVRANPTAPELAEALGRAMWAWKEANKGIQFDEDGNIVAIDPEVIDHEIDRWSETLKYLEDK